MLPDGKAKKIEEQILRCCCSWCDKGLCSHPERRNWIEDRKLVYIQDLGNMLKFLSVNSKIDMFIHCLKHKVWVSATDLICILQYWCYFFLSPLFIPPPSPLPPLYLFSPSLDRLTILLSLSLPPHTVSVPLFFLSHEHIQISNFCFISLSLL